MKILILNWRDWKNPKSGGAEIVTHEHAKAWVKAGHKVVWFTSSYKKAKRTERKDGITIIRRGNEYTVYLLAPFFYFFSGKKFDLIVDEVHGIPFFTPLYVFKPKIVFIHEIAGEIWDYMFSFPFNLVGKLFEKIYLRLYRNSIYWTDAPSTIQELVDNGAKKENCIAIPCPATNKILRKLPPKEKVITLLFTSRLVKMKGIEDVISAFKIFRRKYPKSRLWVIGTGEGNYTNKLKEFISGNNLSKAVTFFGFIPDAHKLELMRKAHILLHASVKEGWGLVVLEAASQGTPSVVYNVSGLRDTVRHNHTGVIVKHNKPEDLAKETLKLIRDKKRYNQMRSNCLDWTRQFSWSKSVKMSLKLIEGGNKWHESKNIL